MEGAHNATLHKRPEALHAVDVSLFGNILTGTVIDGGTVRNTVVSTKIVSVDGGIVGIDVLVHELMQHLSIAPRKYLSGNLIRFSILDRAYNRFAPTALSVSNLLVVMLVSLFSAEICFIYFNPASYGRTIIISVLRAGAKTNADFGVIKSGDR